MQEDLTLLHAAWGKLVRYDRRSLEAAYSFGQVVDALIRMKAYTYEQLGEQLDRSEYTMQLYARLYRKYPNTKVLLETARDMRTYSVARLAGTEPEFRWEHYYKCTRCGSDKTAKYRRAPDGLPPHLQRKAEELLAAAGQV